MMNLTAYKAYQLTPIKYKLLIISTFLPICLSCKKDLSNSLTDATDNPHTVFIQFWDKMNTQYVYWDEETVDWNSVYKTYNPLFEALNDSDADQKKAVSYFKQISSNLIDHHFNITFLQGPSSGTIINPAMERKAASAQYHAKYNYDYVVETYLDKGFISGRGNISNNGELISATVGTINQNLLYFHCNYFALKKSYQATDNNKVKQVLSYFFSTIKNTAIPLTGIILDLRSNNGGNIEDLNFFAGK